ncbi:MAG: TIGR04086 family membrane protein [Pelosinus sp.]|nr:TIGR04086 family membrane protein [Pelosinus sp.]
MAKPGKRTRLSTPAQSVGGAGSLISKGILVSLSLSVFFIICLSLVTLLTEESFVEEYIQYIMVAISIISIFVGSTYAAARSQSLGLFIGISIGILYVLISIGLGMKFSYSTITFLVFLNKIITGIAVGAVGGVLGVNL